MSCPYCGNLPNGKMVGQLHSKCLKEMKRFDNLMQYMEYEVSRSNYSAICPKCNPKNYDDMKDGSIYPFVICEKHSKMIMES